MTPIEIIRAVNGKALTIRAALQIIRHQKKMKLNTMLGEIQFQSTPPIKVAPHQRWTNPSTKQEYERNEENTSWILLPPSLPCKIAVLSEHIRQEFG